MPLAGQLVNRAGATPPRLSCGRTLLVGATGARIDDRSTHDLRAITDGLQSRLLRSWRQLPTRDEDSRNGDGCSDWRPARRVLLANPAVHPRASDRGRVYEREMGFGYKHWITISCCGSAWKKDPGSGVIGVEKGPLIPLV